MSSLVKLFIVITLLLGLGISGMAHSGRTDKYGGHNNRKTGGYHYHNAGSLHVAGNPHQDHTRCGICTLSITKPETKMSEKDMIKALQAGLKCMGYEITIIDGKLGQQTNTALKAFLRDYKE